MIAALEARAAGLCARAQIFNNLLAGLIVGIVVLPLAIAFAIAGGSRPEPELYTAIIAGSITSLFSGIPRTLPAFAFPRSVWPRSAPAKFRFSPPVARGAGQRRGGVGADVRVDGVG